MSSKKQNSDLEMGEEKFTEDHLVDQPAVQLMQHELGWDEWSGGVSDLGRDGKREGGNI